MQHVDVPVMFLRIRERAEGRAVAQLTKSASAYFLGVLRDAQSVTGEE